MSLSGKQKRYLKKHLRKASIDQIASSLDIPPKEIGEYLEKRWGKEKYQKFLAKKEGVPDAQSNLKRRILSFNLEDWLRENRLFFGFLAILVLAAYVNSLGNDFVSDDIYGIVNNDRISQASYIFSNPLAFIRPLIYYFINKLFGLNPAFYRIISILFHLGVTLVTYLLVYLLVDSATAIIAASIFAVHPILTESVVWVSGGYYVQYSLFLLLALLLYIFSLKEKWYYLLSMISFVLALVSTEKAAVFPFILLAIFIAFKKVLKDWRKLIAPFLIGGLWALIYAVRIPQRMTTLQTDFYQTPQNINPLYQIPIAITSYLKLIFWPKNLTLYHSEMSFTQAEYLIRLGIFIAFLGIIVFSYKRNRQVFFWLSFFIISLLPTLTPFGISWIVAERYVYLGAIGIIVVAAMLIKKIGEKVGNQTVSYVLLVFILSALITRTIVRNTDWKNQDALWLATAKTSPSSPQNHNNLGDLYGRRGEFEKAVEEFKKAIELKPGYADAYHNLGNTYQQMGEIDNATENFEKAIEFNPNLWQSYQNLAAIYFEEAKFDQAVRNMQKAIDVNPQNANLHVNLGIIYLKLENLQGAKEAFQKALEIDPQNQNAINRFSQIP